MNILIVQDTDWIRRNPIHYHHLAERLVRKGHRVRVIDYEILWREEGRRELVSRRKVYSVSRILKDAPVTVIRPSILKIPLLDYVSMLFSYRREIDRQMREFAPDIVVGNDILTTYLAYRAAGKRNVPTVFYSIDIDYRLVPFRFLQPLAKIMERRNIRSADLVMAINKGLRDYVIRMGANHGAIPVLRPGIDFNRYDPATDGGEIRARCGIKPSDKVLLFMGWVYHFSGLKEVAREMSKMNDKSVKLLVVGDGDAVADLERMREGYGLGAQLILTGRQPHQTMPAFIAAADVCLLPAYNNEIMRDIVPIKLYEYMAMKKPIVSTRLPGVVQEFGEDSGLVYVDRPEDALAQAVSIAGNGVAADLGAKCRRFVAKAGKASPASSSPYWRMPSGGTGGGRQYEGAHYGCRRDAGAQAVSVFVRGLRCIRHDKGRL